MGTQAKNVQRKWEAKVVCHCLPLQSHSWLSCWEVWLYHSTFPPKCNMEDLSLDMEQDMWFTLCSLTTSADNSCGYLQMLKNFMQKLWFQLLSFITANTVWWVKSLQKMLHDCIRHSLISFIFKWLSYDILFKSIIDYQQILIVLSMVIFGNGSWRLTWMNSYSFAELTFVGKWDKTVSILQHPLLYQSHL